MLWDHHKNKLQKIYDVIQNIETCKRVFNMQIDAYTCKRKLVIVV